jgi:DNA-binding NtrC family response regulator
MAFPRRFLVIDDDSHSRLLVSKTLLRQYPTAIVQECQDLETAIGVVREVPKQPQTVVIAHRTLQIGGSELITALRAAHSSVPIVWMDTRGAATLAASAGATRFLDKDAWLLIGSTVADLP